MIWLPEENLYVNPAHITTASLGRDYEWHGLFGTKLRDTDYLVRLWTSSGGPFIWSRHTTREEAKRELRSFARRMRLADA